MAFLVHRLPVECIGLGEGDDLRLVAEAGAVSGEFGADGQVIRDRVRGRRVDEMKQHVGALDVAEEAVAEAGALVGALDQPGDVGDDQFAPVDAGDAEVRRQRRERIVGDLRLRGGD